MNPTIVAKEYEWHQTPAHKHDIVRFHNAPFAEAINNVVGQSTKQRTYIRYIEFLDLIVHQNQTVKDFIKAKLPKQVGKKRNVCSEVFYAFTCFSTVIVTNSNRNDM